MILSEKGLDFKGRTAFFFYFSGMVATLSMTWVIILSLKLLLYTRTDPSVPSYYITISLACAGISIVSLYKFYKLFAERRVYRKTIEIADGIVTFAENTRAGTREWQEKLRKFDGIALKHYTHRGIESWYIALVHSDKTRSFPIFAPGNETPGATEPEKRQLLARYGSLFNLMTTYEKPDESKKQ